MKIKCMALWQPWATLVVIGAKKTETRSRSTPYRGLMGILATKESPKQAQDLFYTEPFFSILQKAGYNTFEELPKGGVIGKANVVSCKKMVERAPIDPLRTQAFETFITEDPLELAFGDWQLGRYAFALSDPVRLSKTFKVNGNQRLVFDIYIPDDFFLNHKHS